MTRIHHRIQKLEASKAAGTFARSWTGMFAEIERYALSELPVGDRGIIEAMIASSFSGPELDCREEIWKRWEVAWASATMRLGCPIAISANDLLL